jgi:hypothetical protein
VTNRTGIGHKHCVVQRVLFNLVRVIHVRKQTRVDCEVMRAVALAALLWSTYYRVIVRAYAHLLVVHGTTLHVFARTC